MGWMNSRFGGRCGSCGDRFEPGERILYNSGSRAVEACSGCGTGDQQAGKEETKGVPILTPLRVQVSWVVWKKPDGSYTIAKAKLPAQLPEGLPTFTREGSNTRSRRSGVEVGLMLSGSVNVGDTIQVLGHFEQDSKWGWQIKAAAWSPCVEATHAGLVSFLTRLPQIGRERAEAIVRAFGLEGTLAVLKDEPLRLTCIEGITPERASDIGKAYQENSALQAIWIYLAGLGLPAGTVSVILEEWGVDAKEHLDADPYLLATVEGFGFVRADEVAKKLGVRPDDPRRCKAATAYVLSVATDAGHVWTPPDVLRGEGHPNDWTVKAANETGCTRDQLANGLLSLLKPTRVKLRNGEVREHPPAAISVEGRIYEREVEFAERMVAERLVTLQHSPVTPIDVSKEALHGLHENQAEAVRLAASNGVLALTGGPGTGKSTSIRRILDVLEGAGLRVACCAPTGKAAMRMKELTGRESKTIHRLLEFHPTLGFQRGSDCHIEADVVCADEVSMVDVKLAAHLFQAVGDGSRLILVGDADQLPSIGPGRVLADLIEGGTVPVVRLTKIFRQASESSIPWVAKDINEGRYPDTSTLKAGDVLFQEEEDAFKLQEEIVAAVTKVIPAASGIPTADVQVIAPQRTGPVGVDTLNGILQATINPGQEGVFVGRGGRVRAKDRIIHKKNNYDLMTFNGEMGVVIHANPDGLDSGVLEEEEDTLVVSDRANISRGKIVLTVNYGDRHVGYTRGEARDTQLAYAISTHSSQGSQFKAVVFPVTKGHAFMLTRALVYTGITRAEKLLVMLGESDMLRKSVGNTRGMDRRTTLKERIKTAIEKPFSAPEGCALNPRCEYDAGHPGSCGEHRPPISVIEEEGAEHESSR